MKKEEKNKVGRPKLADKKTRNESLLVCLFIFTCLAVVCFFSYKSFVLMVVPNKFNASVINTHINSCVVKDENIDCGPNVSYLKYSFDNKTYSEVNKDGKSIKVKLDGKKFKAYYKVINSDKLIEIK